MHRDLLNRRDSISSCWLLSPLFLALVLPSLSASPALKSDENVIFFPSIAACSNGTWIIPIRGWVLEQEHRPGAAALLRIYLGIREDSLTPEEREIFQSRTRLFLVDAERGKEVAVKVGDHIETMSRTGPSGLFSGELKLTDAECRGLQLKGADRLELPMYTAEPTAPPKLVVHLLGEKGLSVISDIDDTIKVTGVSDRREMLLNTFTRKFQPVPGMASLYQKWSSQGAAFHYVSASPWQLLAPLSNFITNSGFPGGPISLRMLDVSREVFGPITAASAPYKRVYLNRLLELFPKRTFVLVGDSGEKDPEIYGDLARKFPNQIRFIAIRDVTNSPADRYTKAFAELEQSRWRVFKDPAELSNISFAALPTDIKSAAQ